MQPRSSFDIAHIIIIGKTQALSENKYNSFHAYIIIMLNFSLSFLSK